MWTRMLLLLMNCGHLPLKNIHHCLPEELVGGDAPIALSLAQPMWADSRRSCGQAQRRVGY